MKGKKLTALLIAAAMFCSMGTGVLAASKKGTASPSVKAELLYSNWMFCRTTASPGASSTTSTVAK